MLARRSHARPAAYETPPTDGFAIETQGVHKSFGSHAVLRGIDLQIPAGSASAILGPSGTGKSVVIKHIIGLLAPDEGEVLVHGRRLSEMSPVQILRLRRDIGVMFQDGALFSALSIFDNVAFPLRQHTNFREPKVRELVTRHLDAVGLWQARDRLPAELSGGMRKRAGLARALVLEPDILVCDEPDSGLDPVRTALLGELLLARHEQLGGTMIVITHNIALARLVADHMSLLWEGRVVSSGPASELLASEDPFTRQFLAGETLGPLGMDSADTAVVSTRRLHASPRVATSSLE